MKKQLKKEIEKFKDWSKNYSNIPESKRVGEWEMEYEQWQIIEELFNDFLKTKNYKNWSIDDIKNVLYLIARNNEMEEFIEDVINEQPQSIELLIKKSFEFGESNAKWQIAINLGKVLNIENTKKYLEKYLNDENEYVRRRALLEIGKLNHPKIENFCKKAWNEEDEWQEYQRIAVLHVLKASNSPELEKFYTLAKEDGRQYLIMNMEELKEK